jgi:hypothetical protein
MSHYGYILKHSIVSGVFGSFQNNELKNWTPYDILSEVNFINVDFLIIFIQKLPFDYNRKEKQRRDAICIILWVTWLIVFLIVNKQLHTSQYMQITLILHTTIPEALYGLHGSHLPCNHTSHAVYFCTVKLYSKKSSTYANTPHQKYKIENFTIFKIICMCTYEGMLKVLPLYFFLRNRHSGVN